MPTIHYPNNPNTDTAFIEQDDGTRNRALMIAPQDISSLELPNNPNSTKGYVTIDGKKQRVILTADISGSGGSSLPDQTGHSGEFLTTDGTDASWAAVNALPSQTGNSGKFLTTNGTNASWSDKPLVNTATGTNSVSTGGASAATYDDSIVIGRYAKTSTRGVSLGHSANSGLNTQVYYTTSIGAYSRASNTSATALGYNAQATGANSIVLCGSNYSTPASATATHSIQLGYGTNSTANTFSVGLSETDNYQLLSSNGTIPADRLPNAINKYSSMPTAASTNEGWIVQYTGATDATYTHGYIYECVSDGGNPPTYSWSAVQTQAASAPVVPVTAPTLVVADWVGNTQTITVSGVTSSNVVLVGPAPSSAQDYADAGILCTAQGSDSLTFTCTTTPTNAITLSVVIFG